MIQSVAWAKFFSFKPLMPAHSSESTEIHGSFPGCAPRVGFGRHWNGREGRAAAISNGPRKGPISRGKYYFSALHGTCGRHVSHPSRVSSSAGSLPSRCAEAHHLREQSVLETAPRKKSAPSRASQTRGFVLYLTDDFTWAEVHRDDN